MINNKIEKVKNFVKEHKESIIIGSLVTAYGLGSYIWGVVVGRKSVDVGKNDFIIKEGDSRLYNLFNNIYHRYGDKVTGTFTGMTSGGFKPEELGKLGNHMIDSGTPGDQKFTHFIAVGVTEEDENK